MAVIDLLPERAPRARLDRIEAPVEDSDPYGIDVQLALYTCYELHYRGFAGVDPEWEWNPGLLHLRARLEDAFLTAIRREAADPAERDATAAGELHRLMAGPPADDGPAGYLRDRGDQQQLREYFVHCSPRHLREGDPRTWTLPRLSRLPRVAGAGLMATEFDEIVAGRDAWGCGQLFADLMVAADLDPGHLAYIDVVPAEALAVVNLVSLLGLHRRHRGAALGHFAATSITTARRARLVLDAMDRLDVPEPCRAFYRGEIGADSMGEDSVRTTVAAALTGRGPDLEADAIFGVRAFGVVENRLATRLLRCWEAGSSSLRRPLRTVD